jgi:hypothetical protein
MLMSKNPYSLSYGINFLIPHTIRRERCGNMFTQKQLDELKQKELKSTAKDELIDLKELHIPIDRFYTHKLGDYFDFVRNPYMFRVGDVGVKVNFGDGKRFSDSIMDVVTNPDSYL